MSDKKPAPLYTTGDIARNLGIPLHRVTYAIESRGIKETSTAGILRLFDAAAVEKIAAAQTGAGAPRNYRRPGVETRVVGSRETR